MSAMEFACGNVYIRQMPFPHAGQVCDPHAHAFDHTTYVVRGAIRIEKLNADGSVAETVAKRAVDGDNWTLILAGVGHRITALEDNTLAHCIYSHRTPQGEVVQQFDGWFPAYF